MKTTSKRPEQSFRVWLCNLIEKTGGYAQPIESNSTGLGIPDIHILTPMKKRPVWVECKCMKDIDDEIPFEPGQANWLFEYATSGGVSLVAVLCNELVYVFAIKCVDRMTQKLRVLGNEPRYIIRMTKRQIASSPDSFVDQLEYITAAANCREPY